MLYEVITLQHLPADRLDVGRICHLGIGHDGSGIGIDEHDVVAVAGDRVVEGDRPDLAGVRMLERNNFV